MRFRTKAVHAGQSPDPLHGAVMTPVYQTSTFAFRSADDPGEFDYSRSGNPTRRALEQCLAALEDARYAYSFASGMAAEATVMLQYKAGDHVVISDECYGGTYRLMHDVLRPMGMDMTLADFSDLDAVRAALRPETRVVWIESPTNPLMKVVDIATLSEIAHEAGAHAVVDNTFCSPYFQNPLALGADIVVHSTTKYLNGHSDVVGGCAITNDDAIAARLAHLQNAVGAVPAPLDCFLLMRGIKTLPLRMDAHQANGLALAEFLESHPKIERVLHPGLPSHPQYELQSRQSRGNGGTFSFYVKGGQTEAYALLDHLTLLSQAVSLGGVESLIEYPWTMTHLAIPEDARRAMGIDANLVRVSVGIEDIDDLLEDFGAALDAVPQA